MTDTAWIDEIAWPADGPPWLAMGLSRISTHEWLVPDAHRDQELHLRHQLLRERHDEVFGALPGTAAAGAEALELVLAWEQAHAAGQRGVPVDPAIHPLEAAGRRVQEDLVVMAPHDDGYHLDAAVLCFPSHWRLRSKLGGSALAIHGPVPGYADELGPKVDRFLDRLRPDVIVARRNWSVHDSAALFAPDPPEDPVPVALDQVGDGLWLRSERQTLRRLPVSGSVLFTIRVQQAPFSAFDRHRAGAAALAARISAQPAALTQMNGLAPHRDVVIEWLRSRS